MFFQFRDFQSKLFPFLGFQNFDFFQELSIGLNFRDTNFYNSALNCDIAAVGNNITSVAKGQFCRCFGEGWEA